MKPINHITVITTLSFILLLAAILTGCKNSAATEEEHEDFPVGIVLKMNGEEIVRYENGSASGSIEVAEGEETALISIYFLAEDGDEFQPDEPEHSLSWVIEDESVAEVERHAEDGKWSFHVVGLASGSTTVTFQLLHGDHSDFEASGIPINVN